MHTSCRLVGNTHAFCCSMLIYSDPFTLLYNAAGDDVHGYGPSEELHEVSSDESSPLLPHNNQQIPSQSPSDTPRSSSVTSGEDVYVLAETVNLGVVSNFFPEMAYKWDVIGMQLGQTNLVKQLRRTSCDAQSNCAQVLEAAIAEYQLNYSTLLGILRSPGVQLPNIASKLHQAVVRKHQSQ